MADLIDRGKLVDYIMESYPDWCVKPVRPIFDFISGMPSAQPDVPVGDMISRQAAIDEAYAVIVDDAVYDVVQIETLEGLPSVDAVEVVRCEDCKYYHPSYCEIWSRFGTMQTRENGYCYMGERNDVRRI